MEEPDNKGKILSVPAIGVLNNGLDNSESNLICRVGDVLEYKDASYKIISLLGTGTFGQVFQCWDELGQEPVAVKIIKNKPAYHAQGLLEINIIKLLNSNASNDSDNLRHIVKFYRSFECRNHLCLVFEVLPQNLLEILTLNGFRSLPLQTVQAFTVQILRAMIVMEDANVIHCDLKPENILLRSEKGSSSTAWADKIVKVIDFGSSCTEGRTVYSYIQSRFCK